MSVSAIEVESFDDPQIPPNLDDLDPSDPANLTNTQVQLIQRIASLENKVENLASKQDITDAVEFLFFEITNSFRDTTDFIILAVGMMLLSISVLMWGFFFILKAMRRI